MRPFNGNSAYRRGLNHFPTLASVVRIVSRVAETVTSSLTAPRLNLISRFHFLTDFEAHFFRGGF